MGKSQFIGGSLVSVLVPVYNVEAYIERCARSIFDQGYPYLEIVFVDDGCTDSSISILERVMNEYSHLSEKISIIHHKQNRGLAAARNTAVDACHGDFVLHVDSDDWIEPNTIEVLARRQRETGADLVYTSGFYRHHNECVKEDCHGWSTDKDCLLTSFLQDKATISIWSKLIKRSLYTDNKIMSDEGGSYYEDFQVLSRLIYYSQIITSVDGYLYHYNRANSNSIVANIPNSVEIQREGLRSIETVCDFFQDKEQHYLDSVKWFFWHYIHRMIDINSCYGNKEGYEEFMWLLSRLEEQNRYTSYHITCQIEKPSYAELLGYMRFQIADAFPLLRGEERIKSFTDKLYAHAKFCLCRDNGYLVGMMAYYANGKGADFVYLSQAYISPSYRKKGLYNRMLAIVTNDARERGFHEMRLEVDKENKTAITCHLSNGFVKIETDTPNSFFMNKAI